MCYRHFGTGESLTISVLKKVSSKTDFIKSGRRIALGRVIEPFSLKKAITETERIKVASPDLLR